MDNAASPNRRRYRCLAGEIEIDARTADHWRALAVCLGRPELAYEGSWDAVRTAAPDGPIAHVLEQHFAEEPATTWHRRLTARGVPCTVIPTR